MTPQFCLNFSKFLFQHLIDVEPWEIPFFDVTLLKLWIRGCDSIHGTKCLDDSHINISKLPAGFRVIHIHLMKIATPIDSVDFVGLSYMWEEGGDDDNTLLERENQNELEIPGGLTDIQLPDIISDAILYAKILDTGISG
ncbi:hypothetical protein BDZ45DRAFT_745076 [Acephala macrosclerotiorum]|nr:hypothetical protein BDZ45DRAFT_745076 [Acephala macrosclerotiorum]